MSGHLRFLKYYTLFAFVGIGVVTVLLGQVLPILSARLSLNDAQAGVLLSAQFSGALLGTLVVGRLIRRFGFEVAGLIGVVLIIVGLPGLNSAQYIVCWLGIFVYGLGIGVSIPAINLLTIEITPPESQSSAVNLLNFAWGAGAICSRPFVEAVSRDNSLTIVTIVVMIAHILSAICFIYVVRTLRETPRYEAPSDTTTVRVWHNPRSWLFLLFAFFVVGIEGGMSGWLTTYSESLRAAGGPSLNATVVYFSFFVFGRGVASVVSRRVSDNVLLSICSSIQLLGVFLIVISEPLVLIGAAIAGLGSSAIFPTNMVRFAKIFGPSATRQATPMFVAGTSGAAIVTWMIGLISTEYGSLRFGIVVLLVCAAMVAVLNQIISVTHRPESPGDQPVT